MKNSIKLLCFLVLIFGLSAAASANTIWNINATLKYNSFNNTVMGSFTLDPSLNIVTYNIVVGGTNTPANGTYTPIDSFPVNPTATNFPFYNYVNNQFLVLYLSSPVTNAGGTIALLPGDPNTVSTTVACGGSGVCATLVSGYITTIPEPGSLALLGSGVLGMACLLRRKVAR